MLKIVGQAATRAQRAPQEDEDEDLAKPRLIAGKIRPEDLRDGRSKAPRGMSPGKVTPSDLDDAAMTAPQAMSYAESLLHVDRRAEVADVEPGALASAFAFIEDANAGRALPAELRRRLEQQLGIDLAAARVHTDDRAARAAAAIGARAFTIGHDIYFAAGAYDPDSDEGVELIAHEVAHVAQNATGSSSRPRGVSRPDDAHERQAEAFGRRFRTGKRRTLDASDPADLVEQVRREGRRLQIPQLGEIERELGTSFDFVEAYTGDAARLACELMAAGAFAVRNVVAFADASPQRDQLMHELAHVVQMGGRASTAPIEFLRGSLRVGRDDAPEEHDARRAAAGGAIATTADPDVIHRTTPNTAAAGGAKGSKWNEADAIKRVAAFAKAKAGVRTSATDGDFLLMEKLGADVAGPPYYYAITSKRRFQSAEYNEWAYKTGGTPVPEEEQHKTDEELATLADKCGTSGVVKAGNSSWAWIDPGGPDAARIVREVALCDEANAAGRTPAQKYEDYCDAVAKIKAKRASFAPVAVPMPMASLDFDKKNKARPTSESMLQKCRHSMIEAIVGIKDYYEVAKTGCWRKFFDEIVKPGIFANPYTAIQGEIFGQISEKDLQSMGQAVSKGETIFEIPKGGTVKKRAADGTKMILEGTCIKVKVLVDFKSGATEPDMNDSLTQEYISAADDYAAILDQNLPATNVEGPVMKDGFTRVLYVFAVPELSKAWKPVLQKTKLGNRVDVFPAVTDENTGTAVVKANPEFTIPYKDKNATTHTVKNPEVNHSGLKFDTVTLNTGAGGTVTGGSVVMDLDLGAAAKGQKITKPITAEAGNAGRIENKLPGLTSNITKILKGVETEAKLVDDGVEASIKIKPASAKIGKLTLEETTITAKYANGELTASGELKVNYDNNRFSGTVKVGWAGGDWSFAGTVNVAAGVVDGLSAFAASVEYVGGKWRFGLDQIAYTRKFGAITLTGQALGVRYDVDKGEFDGTLTLDADLGMFGKASGSATLAKNKLTKAEISYDSPELKYPAKSDKPTFKGTIGGTLRFANEQFSGSLRGTANLNVPALQKIAGESGLGLAVSAEINPDGSYSGSIATTTAIKFGNHFEIPSISCKINKEGDVSGTFSIKIVKIKYIENASIECAVDKDGFKVTKADIKVPFGKEGDKFHGSLAVSYSDEKGLSITGVCSYKIKEGMVATGTLTYDTKTNAVSVKLTVDEITLIKMNPVKKTLFTFGKQIPLVSIYGLGIYLDIGFDLIFQFDMSLGVKPTVEMEELSLETFEFKKLSAELELLGALVAKLTAQPKVGLGIFALSPSLLRGGGGVKIPITGEAALRPTAKLKVSYAPDGGVTGDAQVGMSLQFGIKGAVKPYAELSVLDGAWNPSWEGDNLAEFEIMPPKELFNFQLDLAGDMTKKEPTIPDQPGPPGAAGPGKQLPQDKADAKESGGGAANKDATPASSGPSGDGGGLPDEPVKLSSMFDGIKGLPGYQAIDKILKKAGAAWEAIKGFFGRVVKTFKSWFDGLASAMEEIIDGFAKEGLGYLPKLIKRLVGDSVWNIIEPIVTAIGGVGDKLLDLFESEPPKSLGDFFPWALRMMSKAWGLAWSSIGSLVHAIGVMFDRLADAAVKIITGLVNDGSIGVRRHSYYIWNPVGRNYYFLAATEYKINVLGFSTSFRESGMITSPRSVVGIALFEALESMGVPSTGGYYDSDAGESSRDRWV